MSIDAKGIIELFAAALAPVTAIGTLWIAYRQSQIEKLKVRHELYEKRLSIFNSTMEMLGQVMRCGNIEFKESVKFLMNTNESDFLCGPEIYDYLIHLYKEGVRLEGLCDQVAHFNGSDEEQRVKLIQEKYELRVWFANQFEVVRDKFRKRLRLDTLLTSGL